jgi:hypothetical protein
MTMRFGAIAASALLSGGIEEHHARKAKRPA